MISNAVLAYKVLVIVLRVGQKSVLGAAIRVDPWVRLGIVIILLATEDFAKAVAEITQQLPRNTRKISSGGQI